MTHPFRTFRSRQLTLATACALLFSGAANAQDQGKEIGGLAPDVQVNFSEIACQDVVRLREDNRGFVMSILYGHAAGRAGKTSFSPEAVQIAIILSLADCIEQPDALVQDVLAEKIARREE